MPVNQTTELFAGAFYRFIVAADMHVKEWLWGWGMHVG
jgi:hypothetical protein